MALALRALDEPRGPVAAAWDAYVAAHPRGSFFHQIGWRRVIERAYGSPAYYLYATRGEALSGVLPLFASGKKPFSTALVSVPVGVAGGVLASDAESADLLRRGARTLAERHGIPYIEYKSERRVFDDLKTKDDLYFTFEQELYGDRDKQLSVIPRKTRAVLRDAERARLAASYNRADLEPFLDLYALSLRNLGTPMFPRELFVACLEEFPRHCDFLSVREAGRVIGVVMNFYFRDRMLPFFAGALPEARDVGVNNYLYWAMLETGHQRGYRWFDFGRSKKDTGPFRFKEHFGMKPVPLEYQYELVLTDELPNVNPTNPKYARIIDTWKKLPVELTRVVGPVLSRRIP